MQSNELVSVIVPAYNAEKYLGKALDSLIAQNYKNWQAIVVDDGSTDGTLDLCRKYAEKDKRICVVTKENGGVSSARNAGLAKACGEYICFLDADDFLEPSFIEVLLCAVSAYGTVVSACDFARSEKELGNSVKNFEIYTIEQAFFQTCKNKIIYPFLWNKMFSAKIIKKNSLEFDTDLVYGEDTLFMLKYYACACAFNGKLAYSRNRLYHYTLNKNSAILRREKTGFEPSWTDQIKALERAVDFAESKNLSDFAEAVKIRITYVCPMILDLFVKANCKNSAYKALLERLRNGLDDFLKSELFDERTKRQIRICAFSPKLKYILSKLRLV